MTAPVVGHAMAGFLTKAKRHILNPPPISQTSAKSIGSIVTAPPRSANGPQMVRQRTANGMPKAAMVRPAAANGCPAAALGQTMIYRCWAWILERAKRFELSTPTLAMQLYVISRYFNMMHPMTEVIEMIA
jgi:hypothetical protein